MQLLSGETELDRAVNGALVITSHRVRYRKSYWGAEQVVSMMLGKIASCGVIHTSNPTLLILAGIAALGFVAGFGGGRTLWFILTAILAVAFYLTRRQVIAIASAGHTIKIALVGISTEEAIRLIDGVEQAQHARLVSRTQESIGV